jgi:hypothetical protein
MADHFGLSGPQIPVNGQTVIFAATRGQDDIKIMPNHFSPSKAENPFRGLVEKEHFMIFIYGDEGLVGIFNRFLEDN